MPYLELNQRLKLHYLEYNRGHKPTVLLVHGLGANCTSWQLQVPELVSHKMHVLAPDIPGFGKSTYPGGGTSISKISQYIAEMITCLQADPICAVGISMGGTIALQLALDYPTIVEKLVLINTYAKLGLSDFRIWPYFLYRLILLHVVGLPFQAKAVARRVFPHEIQAEYRAELASQIAQSDPAGYRAAMRALARFDVSHRLGEIRQPTLVVTGEDDTTVPLPCQSEMACGILNVEVLTMRNSGHATTIDQYEEFNRILLDFLLT